MLEHAEGDEASDAATVKGKQTALPGKFRHKQSQVRWRDNLNRGTSGARFGHHAACATRFTALIAVPERNAPERTAARGKLEELGIACCIGRGLAGQIEDHTISLRRGLPKLTKPCHPIAGWNAGDRSFYERLRCEWKNNDGPEPELPCDLVK